MQNRTAAIVGHAPLCHATTAPFCKPIHIGPTPSIAQSFLRGLSHGQAREALVAIDRHVGDHRVANGYRCRDLDYVLTLPEVRQRTSHHVQPGPRWCQDLGVRRPLWGTLRLTIG